MDNLTLSDLEEILEEAAPWIEDLGIDQPDKSDDETEVIAISDLDDLEDPKATTHLEQLRSKKQGPVWKQQQKPSKMQKDGRPTHRAAKRNARFLRNRNLKIKEETKRHLKMQEADHKN